MITDLIVKFDNRKSFYGKAKIETTGNYNTLYSYNLKVCTITENRKEVLLFNTNKWTQTTLRHVKEFIQQNKRKAESKEQILADYKEYK